MAAGEGLMPTLTHDSTCEAVAFKKDMISVADINLQSKLVNRFNQKAKLPSKFYGCYTATFAKKWHDVFQVDAAGAKNKIDFGIINKPSNIILVMERIEKISTPPRDHPTGVYTNEAIVFQGMHFRCYLFNVAQCLQPIEERWLRG